jgi:hypothetical protein
MLFLLVIGGFDGSVVGHCLIVSNIPSFPSPQPLTTEQFFMLLLIPATVVRRMVHPTPASSA